MNVKRFEIENTGGNIYVAWGEFEDGTFFAIGDDILMVYDEDEYAAMDSDDYDGYTWQQSHTIKSFVGDANNETYMNVLKQIYNQTQNHYIDLFKHIEE